MDEKFVDSMLCSIVMFQKGYKAFRKENKDLTNEEVMALTDVWWRGLMNSVAGIVKSDNTEGLSDGFNY